VQVTEVLDATRAYAAQLEEDNALLQHHLNLVRTLAPDLASISTASCSAH
jgi:hypothetical protein